MSTNAMNTAANAQAADAPGELIDPTGIPAGQTVQPALRLPELEGRRLLLLDNGKLGVGAYAVVADALRTGVPEATWAQATINLLRADDADVEGIADTLIASYQPDACVLALADAGVTAHTALLSMALERHGIPAVMLGTPLGAGLGRAMFRARAPNLEVVVLDIVRTDSQAKAIALTAAAVPRIRALLTSDVAPQTPERASPYPAEAARQWASAATAMASFQDWAEQAGIGDGLPLIPPTAGAVAAHLTTVDADPDALVYGPALTSGRMLRVRDIAANAVMAGCLPRSFPVVLAALRAMAKPGYRLSQAAITTHPSGNAIVLSGVDPAAYGLSAGAGCLGPGHRGNACVGRAASLSVLHLFGARPGEADLTIFGSPAEFTYCTAEAHTGTPWPSLATELGDGNAGVFVLKAEAPRNVLENLALTPEALCDAIAEASVSLCSNNSFIPGELLVFLNPEHATVFASDGWTRQDLAYAIHNLARLARQRVSGRGVGPIRPRYMDALDQLPVTRSPADVHIVVAGAAGPQSMVALPWGYSRGQWQVL
jgi:hypothetical protein